MSNEAPFISPVEVSPGAIWDRLASFPDPKIDEALYFLLRALRHAADADDACWVAFQGPGLRLPGVKNPRPFPPGHVNGGWDPVARHEVDGNPDNIAFVAEIIRTYAQVPSMSSLALVRTVGTFRVHRLHDGFVDMDEYRKTRHFQETYEGIGVRDRIFAGTPMGTGAESFFLLDRIGRDELFTREEADRVSEILRPLSWFQRKLMLSHGAIGSRETFNALDRRIFRLLLSHRSEAEISRVLRQSTSTTHKYVTGLFRKMGVRGRPGFFARWTGDA